MLLRILAALLRVLQILLFVCVLMTWFPVDRDTRFIRFVRACTEPVVMPVRAVLSKIRFLEKIPFDFSYVVVFLVLELLIRLLR